VNRRTVTATAIKARKRIDSRSTRADGRRSFQEGQRTRVPLCRAAPCRHPMRMLGNRRDNHRLMVVDRTRPHEGSTAALSHVSGSGTDSAWRTITRPAAPLGDTLVPTSDLIGRFSGSVLPTAGVASPCGLSPTLVPRRRLTSPRPKPASTKLANWHVAALLGAVGASLPGKSFGRSRHGDRRRPYRSAPPQLSGTAEHISTARINRYHRFHPRYYGPQSRYSRNDI
jgi:hypothetical protein